MSVPAVSPRRVFARRFTELYAAAGNPAMRRVAAAAAARMRAAKGPNHTPAASAQRISDWKSGRNVPARFESLLPVLLTLIDLARKSERAPVDPELFDVREWRRLWTESDGWTPESDDAEPVCPYLGLTSYGSGDAPVFFGRSRSTADFAELVRANLGQGVVLLVGASGAGKSSLLHAGLVPAVATPTDEWAVATVTPGPTPMAVLPTAVLESDRHRLLIVDQFEELFTLCPDERVRGDFLTVLDRQARRPDTAVIIAIRADFYARCLHYAMLEEALEQRSYLLGPMRLDELAEAVTGPAESAGFRLEPGLEELVITELCGFGEHADHSGYDPGALPLLSHVMAAAWHRREGSRLTIAGYRKAGGVSGSVAATAETAWSGLEPRPQVAAKQLLLGLVTVGRDSRDTRRRVSRESLLHTAADEEAAVAALEALSRARLVTLDSETVSLTHEIVLDAWPRLRAWIDEDRVGYLIRQRLESDAAEWDSLGRDRSMLYRGGRLQAAQEHAARAEMGSVAKGFLAAGQSARNRARRRSSTAKAIQAVLVVVVLVLAVAAYSQGRVATRQRNDAVFAGVLAEADRLAATDPSLSAQLDLVARQLRPDDTDVQGRLLSSQNSPLATLVPGGTGPIKQLSYRRDGRVLASAGHDNTVRLWDVSDPRKPLPLGPPLAGHKEFLTSAVFRADGAVLASSGGDHAVRLWDVHDPAHARPLGMPLYGGAGTVYIMAFSPDGRILAAPNDDHTVALWDTTDPAAPTLLGTQIHQNGPVRSVAFSPDGRVLATAGDDTTVQLWSIADPRNPIALGPPLGGFTRTVRSVAFSPDGGLLAAGSTDGSTRLWDVADPAAPRSLGGQLTAHGADVWSVTFGPDRATLATASTDGTAVLWSLRDPEHPRMLGPPLYNDGSALAVVFSPDGRTVVVGGHDGTIRLWSLPRVVLDGHTSRIATPGFSADGRIMVTGSDDGTIQVWDTADAGRPRRGGRATQPNAVNSLVVSSDGRTLASVDESASTVRLFDISDPMTVAPLAQLSLTARYTYALAFSPDSRTLVTSGGDDHSIRLWNIADRAHTVPIGDPVRISDGFVFDAKFSPDGRLLATAAGGRGVLLDVSDPMRPKRIGRVLDGPTNAVRRLAFSPDRRTMISAGDDALRVWDVHDPANVVQIGVPLPGHTSAIDSVSISPDGRTIASGGADATVRLWDIHDREHPVPLNHSFALPSTPVWRVAFDPAGGYLAGAGESGVLRLWDLDVDHAVARICAVTGSTLSDRLWRLHLSQLPYRPPCQAH